MPIAFDSVSSSFNFGQNSLTISHTCSGSKRALFAFAFVRDPGSYNVSSVKYAGVSMSLVASQGTSPHTFWGGLWVLFNPMSGTNSLVVTTSAAVNKLATSVCSYVGVENKGAVNAHHAVPAVDKTTVSTTVNVPVLGGFSVMGIHTENGIDAEAGANTTRRMANAGMGFFDCGTPHTSTGNKTLTATFPKSVAMAVGASISPAKESGFFLVF
jgi:hypothetical protein